jgi:hypothetical protein
MLAFLKIGLLPSIIIFFIHLTISKTKTIEDDSIEKSIKALIARESNSQDTYQTSRKLEDFDKLGITHCSKLEITSRNITIFDFTNRTSCFLIYKFIDTNRIKFTTISGDKWTFAFIPQTHLKYLVFEILILFIFILVYFGMYNFLSLTFQIQSAETESRKLALEQIIHDLKSPLSLLATSSKDRNDLLKSAVEQVSEIINSYSTNTAQHSITNISELINEIIDLKKCEYDSTHIQITHDIEFRAYTSAPKIVVKRILSNLINNSVEASTSSQTRIHFKALLSGNLIDLRLIDNSSGIPKKHIRNFGKKRFSTKSSSRGYGTTYSYSELKNLGGNLSILSTSETGSEFSIKLPIISIPDRIIHFENDKYVISNWLNQSREKGITYHIFKDINDYKSSSIKLHKTDMIFVDKNLDVVDGFSVIKFINDHYPSINSIWLTTGASPKELPKSVIGVIGKEFPFS